MLDGLPEGKIGFGDCVHMRRKNSRAEKQLWEKYMLKIYLGREPRKKGDLWGGGGTAEMNGGGQGERPRWSALPR